MENTWMIGNVGVTGAALLGDDFAILDETIETQTKKELSRILESCFVKIRPEGDEY